LSANVSQRCDGISAPLIERFFAPGTAASVHAPDNKKFRPEEIKIDWAREPGGLQLLKTRVCEPSNLQNV